MKTWLIISGAILGTGTLGFFGLNYYETINDCELGITHVVPFIECGIVYEDDVLNRNNRLGPQPFKPLILKP